jgi:hypothetical protein
MSAPPPPTSISVAPGCLQQVCQQRLDRTDRPGIEREAERFADAAVRLQREDVVRYLVRVRLRVPRAPTQSVLFVGEEHDTNSAPGADAEHFEQANRLPRGHTPAAVIVGAGADIPRVEMPADDHDLFRLLPPAPLRYDIRAGHIG